MSALVENAIDNVWQNCSEESISVSRIGYTGIPDEQQKWRVSVEIEDMGSQEQLEELLQSALSEKSVVEDSEVTDSEFQFIVYAT